MATTVGSFQVASAAFCGALSSSKSRLSSARAASNAIPFGATNGTKFTMSAEWMPGQPRPAHLDGSAPGDFGFDPLGLGRLPENLERYKESEVFHCRLAMAAVVSTNLLTLLGSYAYFGGGPRLLENGISCNGFQPGMLIPEALGLGNWVKAQEWAALPGGQATYLGVPVPWGTLPTILAIEFLAVAFVEHQRTKEPDIEKKKYPGGPFDPLGFSKDPVKFQENKVKEIKNGRLALVAFVGICAQAIAYPGTGPLENLATHLSDPWHRNIADVVIPRSILPY